MADAVRGMLIPEGKPVLREACLGVGKALLGFREPWPASRSRAQIESESGASGRRRALGG